MTDVVKSFEPGTRVAEPAVVPFTYSSRCEVIDGEHRVVPSRLSLMAYDAACYVAKNGDVRRLVVAGEQSYSHDSRTTGDVLHEHTPAEAHGLDITILRNTGNRLLNTPYQVDALAKELTQDDAVTVVCWGFHEWRIKQGFLVQKSSPALEFIRVEDVIDGMWGDMSIWGDVETRREIFRGRYGLKVDWDVVKGRGLDQFETRERRTRIAMIAGRNGWLLKLLTRARGKGRYDDIDEFALPIQATTH